MTKVNYSGLQSGDILKSGVYFYLVVRSDNYQVQKDLIPCRKIILDISQTKRVPGGKFGFQIFVTTEKHKKVSSETVFLPSEMFSWESDLD
jgi:hypothetical protein